MPVEVEVDGIVQRVAIPNGITTITVPAEAHVVVDPMSRVLKQDADVDAFQAWRAEQAGKKKDAK